MSSAWSTASATALAALVGLADAACGAAADRAAAGSAPDAGALSWLRSPGMEAPPSAASTTAAVGYLSDVAGDAELADAQAGAIPAALAVVAAQKAALSAAVAAQATAGKALVAGAGLATGALGAGLLWAAWRRGAGSGNPLLRGVAAAGRPEVAPLALLGASVTVALAALQAGPPRPVTGFDHLTVLLTATPPDLYTFVRRLRGESALLSFDGERYAGAAAAAQTLVQALAQPALAQAAAAWAPQLSQPPLAPQPLQSAQPTFASLTVTQRATLAAPYLDPTLTALPADQRVALNDGVQALAVAAALASDAAAASAAQTAGLLRAATVAAGALLALAALLAVWQVAGWRAAWPGAQAALLGLLPHALFVAVALTLTGVAAAYAGAAAGSSATKTANTSALLSAALTAGAPGETVALEGADPGTAPPSGCSEALVTLALSGGGCSWLPRVGAVPFPALDVLGQAVLLALTVGAIFYLSAAMRPGVTWAAWRRAAAGDVGALAEAPDVGAGVRNVVLLGLAVAGLLAAGLGAVIASATAPLPSGCAG
jgi:hypothetical protein